jgi:hypothetical protein
VNLLNKGPERRGRRGAPVQRSVRFVRKDRHAVADLERELRDIVVRPGRVIAIRGVMDDLTQGFRRLRPGARARFERKYRAHRDVT